MTDLIRRMDAIQACQVGPSDEWARATKDGYNQAATDCQRNILRIEPAPNAGAVKVKRGGKWIVVDGKAYDLRDCTEVAAELTRKSGSNNIAFDMFPWFFTGSPYADQIIDLGVTPQAVPDDFIAEYIPDLGKVWRSRQTIWETYIRTAETTPDPRDAVIARLVEAAEALGAMPEGYCFCRAHRIGDDSKVHEAECSDLRAALAAAKEVME